MQTPGFPEWILKRAAVLAEIGKLLEAKELVVNVIENVRARLRMNPNDLQAASLEASALYVSHFVTHWEDRVALRTHEDRLDELKVYKLDPYKEIDRLTAKLDKNFFSESSETYTYTFDSGQVRTTRTRHLGSGNFDKMLNGFAVTRLCEEAGIPLHVPSYAARDNFDVAAQLIWFGSPLQALTLYLRLPTKTFEDWCSRIRIAALDETQVEVLYEIVIASIEQHLNFIAKEPQLERHYRNKIERFCEFASRLCFRLNDGQAMHLFNAAQRIYNECGNNLTSRNSLGNLYKRLFVNCPLELVGGFVLRILQLPLSGEVFNSGYNTSLDLVAEVLTLSDEVLAAVGKVDVGNFAALFSKFLSFLESNNVSSRTQALQRLLLLEKMNDLSLEQRQIFAEALWKQTDEVSGLPKQHAYYPKIFLSLPEPKSGLAKETIRNYLSKTEIPNFFNKMGEYI